MKALYAGHLYALDNLEGGGVTLLQFHQEAALHNGDGRHGPTCQEVLRAIIDRVQTLHAERPWEGNAQIIYDLRHALAGFEARALIRRVEKDNLAIERQPLASDGHLLLASADTHQQGGDSAQTEAPAPLSGAVPSQTADAQTPLTGDDNV